MKAPSALLLGSWLLAACGSSRPPASGPGTETAEAPVATPSTDGGAHRDETEIIEEGTSTAVPTECASAGEVCTPPRAFVEKLCQDVYPSVALVLFRKGSPYTRGYLTRKTEAWNASGGASISGWLEFDEEVLILKHRKVKEGGMQVSGAGGGYEALRWNGACVTLQGEEVTLKRPPEPKHAFIEWKWLEDTMREALKESDAIREADRTRRKECKGVTMGTVSAKCVKATQELNDLIVEHVNDGGDLAKPEKLP